MNRARTVNVSHMLDSCLERVNRIQCEAFHNASNTGSQLVVLNCERSRDRCRCQTRFSFPTSLLPQPEGHHLLMNGSSETLWCAKSSYSSQVTFVPLRWDPYGVPNFRFSV